VSTKTWKTPLKKHDDTHLIDCLPESICYSLRQGPLIYGFFLTKCLKTGIISIILAAESAFSDFAAKPPVNRTFATLVKIITRMRSPMLLPKVTIRQLLLGMTILGLYSMLLSWAAQGSVVGYSLSLAIALLIVPFASYSFVYWALCGLSSVARRYWLWRNRRLNNQAQPRSERA